MPDLVPEWEWGSDAMAFTLLDSVLDTVPGLLDMEWGDIHVLSGSAVADVLQRLTGRFKYVIPWRPKGVGHVIVIELHAYGNPEGRAHGPEAAQLIQHIGGHILQREEFDALCTRMG